MLETSIQGFLLGLSTGPTCLATCAPVVVPVLLGEGKQTRHNLGLLAQFLSGRLGGYLLLGLLAWAANRLILENAGPRGLVFGLVYVVLAGLMLFYGATKPPAATCPSSRQGVQAWLARWPALLPVGLGFLTGLNLCPPLLLAFTGAASAGTFFGSATFFGAFFLGTSLYFVPMAFLGTFHHVQALRTIGKLTAVVVAVYYLISGISLLIGGISQL
jgi:sulfite exporter TauE/SafE